MTELALHIRFRETRERRGLSIHDVAVQSGVTEAAIRDIEEFEGDLTSCYSPAHVRKFCRVLGISPAELFGGPISEPAVSSEELVRRIHDECRSRGVSLKEFGDTVGWNLAACIEPEDRLLEDITIDGLQWLCQELRIDWRRAL